LVQTLHELQRRGHDVLVIAPGGVEETAPDAHRVGATSIRVGFIYGGQPWGIPTPRLGRVLDAFQPDVVHAVNPVLLGWAGVVHARARSLPLVCSYHTHVMRYAGYYHLSALRGILTATVRGAHRRAHVNLVTAQPSTAVLERWASPRIRMWRGAVEHGRFSPDCARPEVRRVLTDGHPERRIVLHVGRLAAEKELERLLPLAGGDRHLALVGEGPARSALQRAAAGRQVTFAGSLHGVELARAYASADVFAFPSRTDTLGLSLLEAMASGLPVVAARTEASEALLGSAPDAELVDISDAAALEARVTRLLAHPPDRTRIAASARGFTPTWADATEDLLRAYDEALSVARHSASSTDQSRADERHREQLLPDRRSHARAGGAHVGDAGCSHEEAEVG
jgi:glycosyltransferase involved in cell wall biosynthesis